MDCENCKVLSVRINKLEQDIEELKFRNNKLEQRIEVQNKLISRMNEQMQVMCLKKKLLNEMLLIKFNIQVIPPNTSQYLDKKNIDDVEDYVKNWIRNNSRFSYDITKCNENARAVWASLDGSLTKDWVYQSTQNDTSFSKYSFESMVEKMKLFNEMTNAQMMIRFLDDSKGTDGHSLVIVRRNNISSIFQSYFDVSELQMFTEEDFSLIELFMKLKILTNTHQLNATYFGFKEKGNNFYCSSCLMKSSYF
jgi:hypothetical protein